MSLDVPGTPGSLDKPVVVPKSSLPSDVAYLDVVQSWSAVQTFGNNISIGGATLNISSLATNNVLQYNGTNWVNATLASGVTSVTNSDGTLTISPTSGAVVASLALSHSNTWTAQQQFVPVTNTALQITGASAPTGSGSEFVAGINSLASTVGFVTTAQTGDYISRKMGQATLTNPSAGTVTNATTLKITGAPIASTNVTITNAYSLWVLAGNARFQGGITIDTAVANINYNIFTNTDATASSGRPWTHTFGLNAASDTGSGDIMRWISQRNTPSQLLNLNPFGWYNSSTKIMGMNPNGLLVLGLTMGSQVGSSSEYQQGILAGGGTTTWITTAQTGDFVLGEFNATTLVNPSAGTVTNASTLKITGAPIASTNVTITNKYSIWVSSGLVRFDGGNVLTPIADITVTNSFWSSSTNPSLLKMYDGTNTYNIPNNKSGRSTAQTGAVSSVDTLTVGIADSSYYVSANVNVTAATTASFTVTVTYTDETNTSRTTTFSFTQNGVATPIQTITNVTGVGAYSGTPLTIRCKASTTITIATTGTFTSVTYNVEGHITRLA